MEDRWVKFGSQLKFPENLRDYYFRKMLRGKDLRRNVLRGNNTTPYHSELAMWRSGGCLVERETHFASFFVEAATTHSCLVRIMILISLCVFIWNTLLLGLHKSILKVFFTPTLLLLECFVWTQVEGNWDSAWLPSRERRCAKGNEWVGRTGGNVFSAPGKTIKEKRTVAFENLVKGSFALVVVCSLCFRTNT